MKKKPFMTHQRSRNRLTMATSNRVQQASPRSLCNCLELLSWAMPRGGRAVQKIFQTHHTPFLQRKTFYSVCVNPSCYHIAYSKCLRLGCSRSRVFINCPLVPETVIYQLLHFADEPTCRKSSSMLPNWSVQRKPTATIGFWPPDLSTCKDIVCRSRSSSAQAWDKDKATSRAPKPILRRGWFVFVSKLKYSRRRPFKIMCPFPLSPLACCFSKPKRLANA